MEMGLVMLLRVAWIAGTLPILIASAPWSKLDGFHHLLLGFAKRGKTMQSSSSSRVANLVFAAAETHRWYLRKFDNYPRERFAIIPSFY